MYTCFNHDCTSGTCPSLYYTLICFQNNSIIEDVYAYTILLCLLWYYLYIHVVLNIWQKFAFIEIRRMIHTLEWVPLRNCHNGNDELTPTVITQWSRVEPHHGIYPIGLVTGTSVVLLATANTIAAGLFPVELNSRIHVIILIGDISPGIWF